MPDDNFNLVKNEVNESIQEIQRVVIDFGGRVKTKRAELPKVSDLRKQLEDVRTQLSLVKNIMDNINVLYDELEEFLDERYEELQGKKITILEKGKEQMIELIHANLPDNMNLYKSEGNENVWNIVLLLSEPKEATKKKKSVEKKHFYNKDEKIIGEMLIEEIENQLLIKIKVKDESNYQEFKIENSFRVFHIINHIVTRYNYKEEIE